MRKPRPQECENLVPYYSRILRVVQVILYLLAGKPPGRFESGYTVERMIPNNPSEPPYQPWRQIDVRTGGDPMETKVRAEDWKAREWLGHHLNPKVKGLMQKFPLGLEVSAPVHEHDRSYYGGASKGVIRLTPDGVGADTIVHELGHHMELTSAHGTESGMARDMVYDRKATDKPLPLRRLTGNKSYALDEKAYGDRFVDAYVGKVYNSGPHTEVLSMGLQQMYADPVSFYKNDREHFLFTAFFMHGGGL